MVAVGACAGAFPFAWEMTSATRDVARNRAIVIGRCNVFTNGLTSLAHTHDWTGLKSKKTLTGMLKKFIHLQLVRVKTGNSNKL